MTAFSVSEIVPLQVERGGNLAGMYVLSPFVWREKTYRMLARVVPRSDVPAEKIARIHDAESEDGIRFTLGRSPVLAPGPSADDIDGCEDPTVQGFEDAYYVYYTGWNETKKRGQLLFASGPNMQRLKKRGVALSWSAQMENPKEATIARAGDGSWRLFFEFAAGGASRIGVASAASLDGPWTVLGPPFEARKHRWDSWHLSTGPIIGRNFDRPVMFYNGANRDAAWRIGWIAFDNSFSSVIARCDEPLIVPPAQRDPGDTDIAFAASAVEAGGAAYLYYSVADKDLLRATVHSDEHAR